MNKNQCDGCGVLRRTHPKSRIELFTASNDMILSRIPRIYDNGDYEEVVVLQVMPIGAKYLIEYMMKNDYDEWQKQIDEKEC